MSEQPTIPSVQQPPPPSAISDIANRIVLWIARHWLAIFNTGWGLYTILPFLAPLLMHWGIEAPARVI
jgi:hypothetical protein